MSKMKKLILIVVGAIIGIFILVIILHIEHDAPDVKNINKIDGVTLYLNTDIYSNDKESIIGTIQNRTEEKYTTGDTYYLEYLKDGSWVIVSPKVNISEDLLYIHQPDSEIKREYNLNEKYYTLKSGTYRIVEVITNSEGEQFFISAKFEIE